MTEQTSPTTWMKSTLEQVLELIKRESELKAELAQIEKKKLFYKDELVEVQNMVHTTASGEKILINLMTEEHLINTVNMYIRHKGLSGVPSKYLNEVKVRWLIDKVVWTVDVNDTLNDFFNEEDEDEDECPSFCRHGYRF